jgi:hypothetical protein
MRRDTAAMLYWALRWHEGRRVSYRVLSELLWGEFASQPKDPAASLRELMAYAQKRHGDKWAIDDCGRGFRISPRSRSVLEKGSPTVARAPSVYFPFSFVIQASASTRVRKLSKKLEGPPSEASTS